MLNKFRQLRRESKEAKLQSKTHPASNAFQKKDYRPLTCISPQLQCHFFFLLPLKIRLIVYKTLFGNRSLHYHCDWDSEKKEWHLYVYECFSGAERIDWDHCAGFGSHAPDSARFWGLSGIDTGILFSCWKAYIEGLPVLYGSNEFRLSNQKDLCSTLPAQIPLLGLSSIRRLTLWWSLGTNIQPHVSKKNGKNYDSVWTALTQRYTSLTHLRMFIVSPGLAKFELPEIFGEGEDAKASYIQSEWLEGMERLIEENKRLEVFEVHFDRDVYRVLKPRVKYWLKEMGHQRRVKNNAVRYKAFKCSNTTITHQGCPGIYERPCRSGASSRISVGDPRSIPDEFWQKKIQERRHKQ